MPEAPIQEPPPADITPAAPTNGAEPPQPDIVPQNVRTLLSNLNLDGETPKPEDSTPKPDKGAAPKDPKAEPPKDPKATDPTAAAPAAPAEPSIKLRKQKVARPELPLAEPAAPAAPKGAEAIKPDPEWESTLDEEQREMLADARFMEERFPDKYKGWAAKTAGFLKEHSKLVAKEGFDESAPEYKAWLDKNQPRLTREQIREIEEVRVSDRVEQKWKSKFDDIQHEIFVRDKEPEIQNEGRTIFADLTHQALPEDIAKAIKEEGFEKANEQYALEIVTAQNVLTAATEDITELIRLASKDPRTGRALQTAVSDPAHPKFQQHQRLSNLIGHLDEQFKNTAPADKQMRNGKWFVTRDEWNSIRPDQRHRFWTMPLKDYVPLMKDHAKNAVSEAIKHQRTQFQKLGWQPPTRKVAAPPAAPVKPEPPVPTNTPKIPAAVPAPGATDGSLSGVDARVRNLMKQLSRES